ncbi:hypothetical protein AAIH18_19370 [Pantoea agglomerans]|uniref:hypothetical protein n=1 Tax=Enterobacter agglomerans TaxID=549 RepID=UPI003D2B0CA8
MRNKNFLIFTMLLLVSETKAQDLPKEVNLRCDDKEEVMIHFGNEGDKGWVYMRIGQPGSKTVILPMVHYDFPKERLVRMLFDDREGISRKMLIAEGAYYKADSITNKLMSCNVMKASY